MGATFVSDLQNNFFIDPQEDVTESIVGQYERVIVESIIKSFGLDFLLFHKADKHGGDVDTIHNVRQIGIDPEMKYKNARNAEAYANRGSYDKLEYHGRNKAYRDTKHAARENAYQKGFVIQDAYTGEDLIFSSSRNAPPTKTASLDHVISAKKIHDDRGRILAGLSGPDLANAPENLKFTSFSLNASIQAEDIPDYIAAHPELPEKTKSNMMHYYNEASKAYEAKIARAYYTSPRFFSDTAKAAGQVGVSMGIRQMMGFIFMEIWIEARARLERAQRDNFDLKQVLNAIGEGVKQGVVNAKIKYKEVLQNLGEGVIAGFFSSITTTICNIFFTTAKNVVQIIRQSWAGLTEAVSILLLNPDNLLFGERFKAAAKVISATASVIVGVTVQSTVAEVIAKTPLVLVPGIGDVVPTFCGVLLTGILSCTLLYYIDRSELLNRAIERLNKVPTLELSIMEFKKQAMLLKQYAAELMQIDLKVFKEEVETFSALTESLSTAEDAAVINGVLMDAYKRLKITLPWQGDFNVFMQNRNNKLVFE